MRALWPSKKGRLFLSGEVFFFLTKGKDSFKSIEIYFRKQMAMAKMINNQSWQGFYFYFSSGGLPMG